MISDECLGWARTAGFVATYSATEDPAAPAIELFSAPTATRYHLYRRPRSRMELTQVDDGDEEQHLLFVASRDILERHLISLFGDDIREDLGLPFLQLPDAIDDLADGFELSAMVRGYRTLSRVGQGPIAAATDAKLSLLTLVPLSHFMAFSVGNLKRAFLTEDGAPLLRGGRYATASAD